MYKNPAFQTPKPVTLETNYGKLLPTLSKSVIPPKLNLTREDLHQWKKDIEGKNYGFLKSEDDHDVRVYEDWIKEKQVKLAPGFSYEGVMKPNKPMVNR